MDCDLFERTSAVASRSFIQCWQHIVDTNRRHHLLGWLKRTGFVLFTRSSSLQDVLLPGHRWCFFLLVGWYQKLFLLYQTQSCSKQISLSSTFQKCLKSSVNCWGDIEGQVHYGSFFTRRNLLRDCWGAVFQFQVVFLPRLFLWHGYPNTFIQFETLRLLPRHHSCLGCGQSYRLLRFHSANAINKLIAG